MIEYNDRNWGHSFEHYQKCCDIKEVLKIMKAYETGAFVPPIMVSLPYGKILDGNHRLYAQYKLGYKYIDAFVKIE
jgi:hypothetical protein